MPANVVREFLGTEPVIFKGWPGNEIQGLLEYQRSVLCDDDVVVYQTLSGGALVPKGGVLEVSCNYAKSSRRYLPGTKFWANIPTPQQTRGQPRSAQMLVIVEEPTILQQLERGYLLNASGQWEIPTDIGKPLNAQEMQQSLNAERLVALAKDRDTTLEALLPEFVEAAIFVGQWGMRKEK